VSGSPLVSAVIAVHDGERFLGEAIASVLAQTYEPLECVVVDDGSSDRSPEIAVAAGERVRLVRQPRRGAAAARNAGARAARGELLAFLDADDVWEPEKIERQVALFRERPELGFVYCGLRQIDADGHELERSAPPEPAQALRSILLNVPPFIGLAQTGVVRREAFWAAGGFDESMTNAEDSDLAWRLVSQVPVAAVAEPLASYRSHPAQKHRDLAAFERSASYTMRKAFASGLLPPEAQALERESLANLSLALAYEHRRAGNRRALVHLWRAFRLDPGRVIRRALRAPRGARSRAS
jgi:glycosyltransferase involved in cell wall biosynthesis